MRLHSIAAVIALLVLAACTGAPPGSEGEAATSAPTATAEPTDSPEPSDEPTEEPSPTRSASAEVCTMGDMPDLDSGWTFLQGLGGGFGVAYPDDWEDLSGETEFTASTLLDEEIFTQLGREDDATIRADFVRAPDGLPNFSVFVFGPVDSDAERVAEIEAARYEDLPEIDRMVDTSIEACLGGEPARGLSMEFESSDDETYYQQNLYAIRDGELIVVQWLDVAEDPDLELFEDILSTWGWMGFGDGDGDSGSGEGIAEAHLVDEIDDSADEPDPSSYTDSYTTDAPAIYVAFKLDRDAEGTVELTWSVDGEVASEASIDVGAGTLWAWGGITPAPGGFNPGDYEVRLELNGDVETLEFTVERP
jgi:hypothetical protein